MGGNPDHTEPGGGSRIVGVAEGEPAPSGLLQTQAG